MGSYQFLVSERDPKFLTLYGMRMGVEIVVIRDAWADKMEVRRVKALLDTGSDKTSIDLGLAKEMKLKACGAKKMLTGSGEAIMPEFIVGFRFPGTTLAGADEMIVGSCYLNYRNDLQNNPEHDVGLLIGRDILSRWNIVWNGPTSTFFIND